MFFLSKTMKLYIPGENDHCSGFHCIETALTFLLVAFYFFLHLSRYDKGTMPGKAAERRAGQITQVGFDSLAAVSTGEGGGVSPGKLADIATATLDAATFGRPEVYRTAPHRRNKAKRHAPLPDNIKQSTFDDIFAIISEEAGFLPVQPTGETQRHHEQSSYTQLNFDSLAELPPDDVRRVPERKPAGNRTEQNGRAVQRLNVKTGSGAEDGLFKSLGDSDRPVPAARRRRVILDEPEPQRSPSRDFRITPEHGVGTGSLHEKAKDNIAAIRLLKTIEAENRDATDEEKGILVRYAGWGALAGVFEVDFRRKPEWTAVATDLESLLTSEEYESARATTPNAHFTSPLVINAIWHGLEKLGISGSVEVLEPACGIGHFFGLMPEELQGGHRTGVELDSLTARIAKKLYPDSMIFAQGFEETSLPDQYFDVVIGNVPFGDYAVHDPAMRHSLTRSIHDYFFAKSLA